jgi:hypothetical protein
VVCIQIEVEEDKRSSIVVEVVLVLILVVVVVAVAVVAVPTIIGSEYKFGKSSLDLCTFVHTPSCTINDLLILVNALFLMTY